MSKNHGKRHNKANRKIAKKARSIERGNTFNAALLATMLAVGNFLGGLDVTVSIPEFDLGPVTVGPITISHDD